ncbi:MAG TPA: hypothetical protein VGR61_08775 [Candidatus Dormibacteraeota bacterium]|nr:hypothetical protein [Candidatus Dormibacteraeota bacterium]
MASNLDPATRDQQFAVRLLETELDRLGHPLPALNGNPRRPPAPARRLSHLLQRDLPPPRSRQPHPLSAFDAPLKAAPSTGQPAQHFRVRTDRVDPHGKVTLRYFNQLLHIGVGRAYKGQVVRLVVADLEVRVVRDDGLLIRDPSRNNQGLEQDHTVHDVVRHVSSMS